MFSCSKTRLDLLRDSAPGIGLCLSGLRLQEVRCLRTSRVSIKRIHTDHCRPLVRANRLQILQSQRAGIIHWWHPKTPKTDEILDEVPNAPGEENGNEDRLDAPPRSSNTQPEESDDRSKAAAAAAAPTSTSTTYPQIEEHHVPFVPLISKPVPPLTLQMEKAHVPRKPKHGYTLKLENFENAKDTSSRTRDGIDMDSEVYAKQGVRRVASSTTKEDFRRTMRALPGAIVVLTTANYREDAPNVYRGMTISSFSSLSMSPEPLVTFNIKSELKPDVKPSRVLRLLRKSSHFLIHVVNDTPEGVRLANFFATVHEDQFSPEAQEKAGFEVEELTGFRYTTGTPLVLPRLRGKGISRVIRCEILRGGICVPGYDILGPNVVPHEIEPRNKLYKSTEKRSIRRGFIRVGDHVLCIAKVLEVIENNPPVPDHAISGLGYMDGKYRTAGTILEIPKPETAPGIIHDTTKREPA